MKVQLDKSQIDEVAKQRIEELEKENKSLRRRIETKDKKIREIKDSMDITKERRASIRDTALRLVDELRDAEWVDYDE